MHTYMHMCINIYIYIYVYIYICVSIYIYMYIFMFMLAFLCIILIHEIVWVCKLCACGEGKRFEALSDLEQGRCDGRASLVKLGSSGSSHIALWLTETLRLLSP